MITTPLSLRVRVFLRLAPVVLLLAGIARAAPQAPSLDLRNAEDYRRFTESVERAGLSRQSHSALYDRLEAARGKAPAKPRPPRDGRAFAAFVASIATDDQQRFQATAVVTIPDGSDFVMATLQIFDAADQPIGTAKHVQEEGAKFVTAQAEGVLPSDRPSRLARAVLNYYVETPDGPIANIVLAESGTTPKKITSTAPATGRDPKLIRVCVGRRDKTCDYFSPKSTRFPVQGSLTFGKSIDRVTYDKKGQPKNAGVVLQLLDRKNGGGCTAVKPADFFRRFTKIKGGTISWKIQQADFGACYPRDGAFVSAVWVSVGGVPALASIGDLDDRATRTTRVIPPISVIHNRREGDPRQDAEDLQHVLKGRHVIEGEDLDLRDPVHYRFMRRQFERAGYTPTRYPQLFRSLEELSKKGPTKRTVATTGPEPLNMIVELKTNDQKTFQTQALSSIPLGTNSTMLVLGVYNEADEPIGPVKRTDQFYAGTDVLLAAEGDFGTPTPTEGRLAQAVGSYFYEDRDGNHHSGIMANASNFYPKQIIDNAPIATKNPNQLVVCLNRSAYNGDCDYDCSTGLNCTKVAPSDWDVRFPLIGSVQYYKPIDVDPQTGKPKDATSRIVTTFLQNGGACKLPLANFLDNPNTKVVNGDTLTWSINPAVFGNACYPGRSDVTFAFMVMVYTQGTPISAFINNTGSTPAQSTFKIPPMKIYQGCLAAGSKVLMSDGSEVVIEKLDGHETVRSGGARTLHVAGTMFGNEGKPLVKITTRGGHSLTMTQEHPVVTPTGIRLAKRLKVGDVVTTVKGTSRITAIAQEAATGKVHNLDVGMPEDEVKLTMENRTFYANGILVGDATMQGYWQDLDERQHALREIPKRWLVDAQSAREDAQRRK